MIFTIATRSIASNIQSIESSVKPCMRQVHSTAHRWGCQVRRRGHSYLTLTKGNMSLLLTSAGTLLCFLVALSVGLLFKFDGQSAILAFPFLVLFYAGTIITLVWTLISVKRFNQYEPRVRTLILALALINTVILVSILV
jgi:hypothetical protein